MRIPPMVVGLLTTCLIACGQSPAPTDSAQKSAQHPVSSHRDLGRAVLTREEVAAILGSPVTFAEGAATDMEYRTDTLSLETTIGIEVDNDSEMAMTGARKATTMLGGTPEEVPDLGDEAFFGSMSVLYVRKGDDVITVTPPNFQQIAAIAAYGKVTDAKMGSAQQAQAMNEFVQTEKTDPVQAGLQGGDDTQGALAVVAAASQKQGTAYEAHGRSVAVALAEKVLSKL